MYILSQVNKETIWGSRELIAYGADPALDKVGSLYTLAANEELSCKVLNGPNAGRRLYDVYRENPQAFGMGAGESFPLIISFISAGEDLSIQIHPDDAYARRVENKPFGKSESWFFLRKPASGAIAMGCVSYLVILSGGIASNGFRGVGSTLKEFSLPISMSFRLFGAMLSGLLVTELVYYTIMLSIVLPVIVAVLFTLLHALIQTYVLTMLTSVFYGEVSEPHQKKK